MLPSKEEMALTIDEADWSCLRAHLHRGGLILVDDSLDLADTAHKVAADDIAIIQMILAIGQTIQCNIVAEGIEELAQFEMLKKFGCHYFQGFYFFVKRPD